MVWIDYRKAYDFVPHRWIVDCLHMHGFPDNVKLFGEKHEEVETSFEFQWVGFM